MLVTSILAATLALLLELNISIIATQAVEQGVIDVVGVRLYASVLERGVNLPVVVS